MSAGLTEPLGATVAESGAERHVSPGVSAGPSVREPRAQAAGIEMRAHLRGVGLWTSAHASFEAWIAAGAPERWTAASDKPVRPPASMLHPRLRRRTSTLTRAAVTAIEAATGQAGVDLAQVRFVLVSSFGEIETTVALLEQLAEPHSGISPTKFHNSVHNTATGYMSIATGNQCEATALAAGPHSLEIGLLEVLADFADTRGDNPGEDKHAVLVFAEEHLPAPFARDDAEPTFAVALHLSTGRPRAEHSTSLDLELCVRNGPMPSAPTALAPGVGGVGLPSMVAPLFALLRGIREQLPGHAYPLAGGHDPGIASTWSVSLQPGQGPRSGSDD